VTLSRKDFFRQSFFSLGDTLLKVGGTVQEVQDSRCSPPVDDEPDKEPLPDRNMVATADNQHCLAKNCGCYSCMERCEAGAIMLIPGTGIRINEELCAGCGICQYICPVTPKAIRRRARTTIQKQSADQAGTPQEKGESPC